jgi:hypothetical protein
VNPPLVIVSGAEMFPPLHGLGNEMQVPDVPRPVYGDDDASGMNIKIFRGLNEETIGVEE